MLQITTESNILNQKTYYDDKGLKECQVYQLFIQIDIEDEVDLFLVIKILKSVFQIDNLIRFIVNEF